MPIEQQILSEEQIAKIEADIAARDDSTAMESACGEYNCPCHDRLPALCATVRVLRAENDKQDVLIHELRGDLETRTEQRDTWRARYDEELKEHSATQSQLEQVTKERDLLSLALKREIERPLK